MTVISFAEKKAEREPHWHGEAVCLGCRYEWHSVASLGTYTGLECPDCSLPKGVVKYLFGADVGDAVFSCNCGCEAMTVYRRKDGKFFVRCMACGYDQTEAIYG